MVFTVTLHFKVFLPALALIVTVPILLPFTFPVEDTVAIDVLDEVHLIFPEVISAD